MSKIICDICGTSYQETAKQCPICGCVRPGDVQRVTNEVKNDGNVSTGYTYVKGGRFSKSNVKKRNNGHPTGVATPNKSAPQKNYDEENKSNRGLVIIALLLLLAIICVVIFIAVRFFGPISDPGGTTANDGTKESTTDTGPLYPPCESLTLDTDTVILEQEGDGRLLYVEVMPKDTADIVTFRSENVLVATVSDAGKITAVGEGTTKIIITCGKISKECNVICQFTDDTSTTEPSSEPTTPKEELRLNRKDITFSYKGESWVLYNGSIAKNLITWTSDNESIVTFTNGRAVAVGSGTTKVHAEYDGQKVSCIIRCSFKETQGVGGHGGVTEDGGSTDGSEPTTTYAIHTQYGLARDNDITIGVGDKIYLALRDSAGNAVIVTWTISGSACTLDDKTVTGAVSGKDSKVFTTYEGITYTCTIRVR